MASAPTDVVKGLTQGLALGVSRSRPFVANLSVCIWIQIHAVQDVQGEGKR